MDQDRDIYSKPPAPPPEQKEFPEVDVTPRLMRRVTQKRVLGTLSLVMLVLGVAVLLFLYLEERGQREDLENLSDEDLEALIGTRTEPSVSMPRTDMPTDLSGLELTPPPVDLEPAKVAEAMGHVRLAREYLREQEWDRAEIEVQQALGIWPGMATAKRTLGFIYAQRGQFDQGIQVLNESLQTDPFNAEAYNTLAALYMQKGEMTKAEDLLHTSLDIRPDYLSAYINLGMLYLLTAQYDWAAEQFERVLESRPDNATVRNNYAVCLIRLGRYREAQTEFHTLMAMQPDVPTWYFNMAVTYTEQQDFDTAMEWVRQGADRCSPLEFQEFIADRDFDELREQPIYKEFRALMFPDIPVSLGSYPNGS